MKITGISLYHYDWVVDELEGLQLSKERAFNSYPGRVVKVETNSGLTGWGENVPHGTLYTEAFAGAIQPGIDILAPALLGMDPTNVRQVVTKMDNTLLGHPFIKDPLDTACWDIFGQYVKKPLYELWGGKLVPAVPVVAFLPRDFEKYEDALLRYLAVCRQQGYTQFQTKACYGPEYAMRYIGFMEKHLKAHESLWFDFNRGCSLDDALKVCRRAQNISFYIEQPCETYEECREVMRISGVPVILDECIVKMKDLARAAVEGGIGGLNLKIGRVGGPTKALEMRDFCIAMNIPVYPMTTNSTEIGDAVLAHIGHSTPTHLLRYICAAHQLGASSTAEGLKFADNTLTASEQPGLGLRINEENLKLLQSWA